MSFELYHGDSLVELKKLKDNSVDSIVTDPPYGLAFMGAKWDYDVPSVELWKECFRVLKPGGHLLSFAGTRTQHRMAVNIEDAGFEIRDMIAWVYGQGFPKNLDVSKAIDSALGAERKVVGKRQHPTLKDKSKVDRQDKLPNHGTNQTFSDEWDITAPESDMAKKYAGWGTQLKPSLEPITVARKPVSEKNIALNVMKHGTGAINIDGCRIEYTTVAGGDLSLNPHLRKSIKGGNGGKILATETESRETIPNLSGRYPANLIHDGSEEVVDVFPNNNPGCKPHVISANPENDAKNREKGWGMKAQTGVAGYDDGNNLSAARFFYCAKPSTSERNMYGENKHLTVKPIALMRYLVKMVTPKGGVVLDPFMGSGTTGIAAVQEEVSFIGVEREKEYHELAKNRITAAEAEHKGPLADFMG